MTPADAFLQDILAHPDDDAPRLVYADWLDEHGDAERAEFIRTQCELARLAPDDERYGELQARERRLYVAHGRRWVEGVPYAIFRRGFVDELYFVEPEWFVLSADQVFHRHPVRSVWFTTQEQPGWGPELAACPYLARLHTLSLRVARSHHVAAEDVLAVTGSRHLTGLRVLDVGENGELTDEVFAEMIGAGTRPMPPAFRALRKLGLDGGIGSGPLGDRAVAALLASPLAGTLTQLDLSGNRPITPAGFRELFGSPLWPRLEELRLSYLYQETAEAAPLLAAAMGRSRLQRLDLAAFVGWERPLAARLAEGLATAPSWGPLRWLDLSNLDLGAEGARLADCPHLAELSRLDLGWCELTDDDLEALVGCPRLGGLTAFKLSDNYQVGNASLKSLAASPYLRRLVYLNLAGTSVTGTGLAALARSPNSARLRVLMLPMTVGDAGLKALAASPHPGRLTSLLRGGGITRTAGERSPRAGRVGDAGVRALVDSPHLRNLTYLELHPSLTEKGQRALLEAGHIAWPGLSGYDLKSPEMKALYKERFGGPSDYGFEVRAHDPFLTYLP